MLPRARPSVAVPAFSRRAGQNHHLSGSGQSQPQQQAGSDTSRATHFFQQNPLRHGHVVRQARPPTRVQQGHIKRKRSLLQGRGPQQGKPCAEEHHSADMLFLYGVYKHFHAMLRNGSGRTDRRAPAAVHAQLRTQGRTLADLIRSGNGQFFHNQRCGGTIQGTQATSQAQIMRHGVGSDGGNRHCHSHASFSCSFFKWARRRSVTPRRGRDPPAPRTASFCPQAT